MKNQKTLTLEDLARKWVGRMVYSSVDHQIDESGRHPRPVTEVRYNAEYAMYIAFSDEHHSANTAEALDRRLESLAVRQK